MEFEGRYLFKAERRAVWQGLNDADVLKSAIPGCTRIAWVDENSLEAEISVSLGITKLKFTGDLTLSDVDPAVSYHLSGRGRGLLGKAEGAAHITLEDEDDNTILTFRAVGGASGKLVSLGKSLLGTRAQGVIDGFFERIGAAMRVDVTPLESD